MLLSIGSADHRPGHRFARETGFAPWTLSVLWRGHGRLTLETGVAEPAVGDVIVIRPRTPYMIEVPSGGSEIWAILTPPPAWERLLAWPQTLPGLSLIPAVGAHGTAAREAFRDAAAWWRGGAPQREALALNAIERGLLLLNLDRPGAAWADLHPAVRAAVEILAPGPAGAFSIAALARRVGCSPSHLAHLFRAQIGTAPLAWLEERRLAHAQQLLLTTDWPLKRIAEDCGFADGEHLSRRFRARQGISPGAWRRRPAG